MPVARPLLSDLPALEVSGQQEPEDDLRGIMNVDAPREEIIHGTLNLDLQKLPKLPCDVLFIREIKPDE